jgi:inositol-hexakisphosphate kinase
MQVWDAKNKGYIFQDKYYGRDLHAGKEFQNALTRYITSTADGDTHVLTHHIPTIICKINQLGSSSLRSLIIEAIVRNNPQYRLYATSLLFLYDGASKDEIEALDEESGIKYHPDVRVKIVDFAHALTDLHAPDVVSASFPPQHPKNADRGYIKGLTSIKSYFQKYSRKPSLTYEQVRVDRLRSALSEAVIEDEEEMDTGWSDVSV